MPLSSHLPEGSVLLLRGVVTRVDERVGGEHHGAEVRRAQKSTTHLFEHHTEFHVTESGSAVLLGDVQALQAHLLTHLLPDGLVETTFGFHLLAHGGLGALRVEERPDCLAEFFLFF